MRSSQPLPRIWLMTDERLREGLMGAIARLPPGAGIVFRHYSLSKAERCALFERVRAAHAGLLLLAGSAEAANSLGADGSHGPGPGRGLRTASAHDVAEIRAAETAGAAAIFLGPVFPTRSHPGRPALGPEGFAALAGQTALPVIALGGMDAEREKELPAAYGWAGIDAWTV